jgi:hypothetical protein
LPMIVILSINDAKTVVLERPLAAQQLSQDSNGICGEGQLKNSSSAAEIAGHCRRNTRESIAGRFEPSGTRFAVRSQRVVADK